MATALVYELLARDRASGTFDKFGNSVDRSSGKLGKFGSIAGKVGKAALFGVAGAATAGGIALFKFGQKAGDMNETISKTNQIFGKNFGGGLQKWAETADTSLGLSKQSALDAASTFGVFGKAAGKSGNDLASFAAENTQLAADLASFNNTTPEEAIEALGAAFRGESEPLRRYGVLLDDASMRQQALKMGLVKTTAEALTPQQKILAAQALILKQTSDAQGDFERTSGGLANQQRILKAEFENAQVAIGQKVLPILLKLATFANTTLIPALGDIGRWTEQNVVPALQKMGDWVGQHIMPVFEKLGREGPSMFERVKAAIAEWLPVVGRVVQSVGKALVPIVKALAETFREHIMPTIGKVIDKFREWQPSISKVIEALGPVIALGVKLAGRLIEVVVPAILDIIDPFVRSAGAAVDFGRKVAEQVGKVSEFVKGLKQKFGDAVDYIKGIPGKVVSALGDLGSLLLNAGKELIGGLISGITEKARELYDKMREIAGKIKDFLPGSPVKTGPLVAWNDGSPGKQLVDMLIGGIESRQGKLREIMLKMGETIAQTVKNGWKPFLKEWFADQLAGMRSAIADLRERRNQFADFSGFRGNLFGADISGAVGATTTRDAEGNEVTTPGPTGLAALRAFAAAERAKAEQAEADIAKLTAMGISQDLLEDLKSQGAAGLDRIHELASASQEEANEIFANMAAANAAYQRAGSEAATRLDDQLAQMGRVVTEFLSQPLVIELHVTQPDGRTIVRRIHAEERAANKKYLVDA